jgi:hypothetical protein
MQLLSPKFENIVLYVLVEPKIFFLKYDRSYAKAVSQMQPEQLYKQILQHDN